MVSFEALSEDVREEVDYYSRAGLHHPDPEVDRLAQDWAAETLSRGGTVGAYAAMVLDFAVSILLGGGGGGTTGNIISKRRMARRIVAASHPKA